MRKRPVRTAFRVVCIVLCCGLSAAAGGLTFGVPLVTLDLSTTITQLPNAVGSALDALEAAAIDLGVSTADLEDIRTQFDDAISGIAAFADDFPVWVPVPLIGGGIEIGLPLLVIDGIRVSGGWLSERLVRTLAGLAGAEIAEPLVDLDIDIGEYAASLLVDLDLRCWAFSTEVIKRFDWFLLAWNFGAGIDLIGGEILPLIDYDLPQDWIPGAMAALEALHLDELTWSGVAVHGMIGFELGPPFLRLYGDLRWTTPLSQANDWWGIRLGPVSALLGFVIHF